jgi:hypothetical protein
MTVVCCWLNNSYGQSRITAIADTRATQRWTDGTYKVLTETTSKLFRVRVRCHDLNGLDLSTGGWTNPYYETEIGIGFAGYCFEAQSIIALVTRALEDLAATDGNQTKPHPAGIVGLAAKVVERFFAGHTNSREQEVDFLIFGYSPLNNLPWLWHVSHRPGAGVTKKELPLGPDDFHVIGSITSSSNFVSSLEELRGRISSHKKGLQGQSGPDGAFELDLEVARHEAADKKAIEEEALSKIESEFAHDVGGVLQKMEAYEVGGATAVTFTRDDQSYVLDRLPMVGANLGYIPIGERMGRG